MGVSTKKQTLVVAGDVSIEWRFARSSTAHGDTPVEVEYYTRCYPEPGGADSLGRILKAIAPDDWTVLSPEVTPTRPDDRRFWHAFLDCSAYPGSAELRDGTADPLWRINKWLGVDRATLDPTPETQVQNDSGDARLVVVEEARNGFARRPDLWPQSFVSPIVDDAWLVLRWFGDLKTPDLVGLLTHARTKFERRLILVTTVDELRLSGMRVSRSLSWEQTVEDLVREVARIWDGALAGCAHLLVTFFTVGVVVFSNDENGTFKARLYYDPLHVQGTWEQQFPGSMLGYTRCLIAGIVLSMLSKSSIGTVDTTGIVAGLLAARKLHERGYTAKYSTVVDATLASPRDSFRDSSAAWSMESLLFPTDEVVRSLQVTVERGDISETFREHEVPVSDLQAASSKEGEQVARWTILNDELTDEATILEAAFSIVKYGDKRFAWPFPIARFGALLAIERTEIESLRALEALINNYMGATAVESPVSIAVFGKAGNGKSFAIKAVAEGLSVGRKLVPLTFNLSQFSSPEAITNSLHQVRDVGLSGMMPLVFWDEFDSSFGEIELGWLRFFLAPMQDGAFLEGAFTHQIGKAIFVFAGGRCDSKSGFDEIVDRDKKKKKGRAKAKDFLSRLRGFVDVPDLDYPISGHINATVALRRAVRLRTLLAGSSGKLMQREAARGEKLREYLNVDSSILRAFLTVPSFEHGARSMEAIVKMSALSDRMKYEPSLLPPANQLRLHVNDARFLQVIDEEGERIDSG